ncbi:hypothetical protein, partial [Streptomyces sp. NRRL F-6492]|uniref:hypothetical protein n=1 Tax=Streptomyces sp. NRRL F-6492 TaxID=1519497 RepID=UPI0006C6A2EF
MRESHRAEAEGLLERVVAEEAGGRGAGALLARGRAELDAMAAGASAEYAEFLRAVEAAEGGRVAAG